MKNQEFEKWTYQEIDAALEIIDGLCQEITGPQRKKLGKARIVLSNIMGQRAVKQMEDAHG